MPPLSPIHPKQPRPVGRAALSNPALRFERLHTEAVDDGWDSTAQAEIDDLPPLRTEVRVEQPRRVITRNRSPDISFDRSINPYRGCEHGCIYCFARPSHAFLGLSPGLDFETKLIARPDAPARLRDELRAKSYQPKTIALGTNTDPYQPIEKGRLITREILKILRDHRHPVGIVTKGALIERDIDILTDMARDGLVRVGISVTTLDPALSRRMEPRVPAPKRRLQVIERLSQAGIPVRICASPMIPALTDPELEAILTAGRDAGAIAASWILLRLPYEVSPLFREWLAEAYPDRAARVMARIRESRGGKDYDAEWGRRMRGEGHYAQLIAQRFRLIVKRLGLATTLPPLPADQFHIPPQPGDQLSLF
ncbi:MAG: PA0069 family radical SAM protein [Pseudomonadota bacterium]